MGILMTYVFALILGVIISIIYAIRLFKSDKSSYGSILLEESKEKCNGVKYFKVVNNK